MWASMATKSNTMNWYPSFGTNAVCMSAEWISGTESHIMEAFFYNRGRLSIVRFYWEASA
mgnify:CR=1 FL=1